MREWLKSLIIGLIIISIFIIVLIAIYFNPNHIKNISMVAILVFMVIGLHLPDDQK